MKRFLIVALILCSIYTIYPCSMFTKTKDGKTLVGNNEDWKDPETFVWFAPAAEGKYGVCYLGYKNFFPQGGMNDQGLCFDGFATKKKPIENSLDKPVYDGWLIRQVMETCSTIDEVIALYDTYNLEHLEAAMLMFVDRTGDAAIIEGDQYIRKEGDFQIIMNFYPSEVKEGKIETCSRFNNVLSQISDADVSRESFKRMLASVHQEGTYSTQYSNIFDPNTLKLYLYHFHNFENEVEIDIAEELTKGEHVLDIPALFPETQAYEDYKNKSLRTFANRISQIIDKEGIAAAWEQKDKLREDNWVEYWYPLDEFEMNDMGYAYLASEDIDKAIAIFQMNAEFFPESWNVYDSLGEAYWAAGNKEEAIVNYEKSLDLNPDSAWGIEALKKIKNSK